MSEYGAVPPPGTGAPLGGQASAGNGGGIKKDAFADAVQRARQVRERGCVFGEAHGAATDDRGQVHKHDPLHVLANSRFWIEFIPYIDLFYICKLL